MGRGRKRGPCRESKESVICTSCIHYIPREANGYSYSLKDKYMHACMQRVVPSCHGNCIHSTRIPKGLAQVLIPSMQIKKKNTPSSYN